MLRDQLPPQGIHAGQRHLRTLMLRKLAITRAHQVWALNTTYISMAHGLLYLTAVVDVVSRRVLAHKMAITLEACYATAVIEHAFALDCRPEIVNTDRGNQVTGEAFTRIVLGTGCKLSMVGSGIWRDNLFVERLWRIA